MLKMKKAILFLVVFLYLVPAVGITVSAHYCSGELSDISFGAADKALCPCGSGIAKKSCCEDVIFSLKLDGQQQKANTGSWQLQDVAIIPPAHNPFVETFVPLFAEEPQRIHTIGSPPGRFKTPLYIQNESFLI